MGTTIKTEELIWSGNFYKLMAPVFGLDPAEVISMKIDVPLNNRVTATVFCQPVRNAKNISVKGVEGKPRRFVFEIKDVTEDN